MAMMISKFHKLIQSKVVWYIVLGVIVIAFVGFFTPTMGQGAKKQKKSKAIGELFGKEISPQEFRHASRSAYLWTVLSSGQMPKMTDEVAARIEEQAWVRLAALMKARKERILVADDEVVRQIQQMPVFQSQTGQFAPASYKAALNALNLSSAQAEQLFREQIIMFKLMSLPAQAALISPEELADAYRIYTDRFVLDYALLSKEDIAKTVTATREEAEELFTANIEAFRMPAKVQVNYVEIPVKQFVDQADVPEGGALQIYNQNLQRFIVENEDPEAMVEYKAFEDVEEEINGEIRMMGARRLAAEEATALVVEISPKAEGEQPDFAAAAAAAGMTIKTLPPFGPSGPLSGIDATSPFRRTALSLQDDAYGSFSDAVVGKDFVYVIFLEKRFDSFLPEFSAVEAEATDAARAQAVQQAVADRGIELGDALSAALEAGTSFAEAAAAQKLTQHHYPGAFKAQA